jgi:hypothetical protein
MFGELKGARGDQQTLENRKESRNGAEEATWMTIVCKKDRREKRRRYGGGFVGMAESMRSMMVCDFPEKRC